MPPNPPKSPQPTTNSKLPTGNNLRPAAPKITPTRITPTKTTPLKTTALQPLQSRTLASGSTANASANPSTSRPGVAHLNVPRADATARGTAQAQGNEGPSAAPLKTKVPGAPRTTPKIPKTIAGKTQPGNRANASQSHDADFASGPSSSPASSPPPPRTTGGMMNSQPGNLEAKQRKKEEKNASLQRSHELYQARQEAKQTEEANKKFFARKALEKQQKAERKARGSN